MNIVEVVVATVMIVIAGISWAVVLGQVCGVLANLTSDEAAFRNTMDELHDLMQHQDIPSHMRKRLRSFFLSHKSALRLSRHQKILNSMSSGLRAEVMMEMNRRWILKVSLLARMVKGEKRLSNRSWCSRHAFIMEVSNGMNLDFFAQSEIFGLPQTLYVSNRGLVARNGRLQQAGSVWGVDFILRDRKLQDEFESFALTYSEVTTLSRSFFLETVDTFRDKIKDLPAQVRYYTCWLAAQRAILREAKKRKARLRRMTVSGHMDQELDETCRQSMARARSEGREARSLSDLAEKL